MRRVFVAAVLALGLTSGTQAADLVGGWRLTSADCGQFTILVVESASRSKIVGYVNEASRKISKGKFDGEKGAFALRVDTPVGLLEEDWTFTVSGDAISARVLSNTNSPDCTFEGMRLPPLN